jgi:hypothetical protein
MSIPGAIALTVDVVTWRRLLANGVGHRSSFSRIRQLVVPPSTPRDPPAIGDRRFEGLGLGGEVVAEGATPDVGLARARVNA